MLLGIAGVVLQAVPSPMFDDIVDAQDGWTSIFISLFASLTFYVIVPWSYFAGMASSNWQATFGKEVLGIIVTDHTGNRVSFLRATVRHFSSYLSAFFLVGYLVQPFTQRRQALHDLIAGTIVVRRFAMVPVVGTPVPVQGPIGPGRAPKWAIVLSAAILLLLVGCGVLAAIKARGVVSDVFDDGNQAVRNEVSQSVERSVDQRIVSGGLANGELALNARDLDVNNTFGNGEVIFEWGTAGTTISGVDTMIDPTGIQLVIDDAPPVWLRPIVRDGHLELSVMEETTGIASLVFPEDALAAGLEDGINAALAQRSPRPITVALRNSVMTITVTSIKGTVSP
jgi:uncharacterized RDD family membrane protein YckC